MKKIFSLSVITLLFLTSCLLFSQKAESTAEPQPGTSTDAGGGVRLT